MMIRYSSLMLLGTLWLTACGSEAQISAKSQPQSSSPTSSQLFTYAVAPGTIVKGELVAGPVQKISIETKNVTMFKKEAAISCRPIEVGSMRIKRQISVGDIVRVGEHEIRIGYITAWRHIKSNLGTCRFYETTLDAPVDGVCIDGLWVDVERCRVLEGPEIRLPPDYGK